MSNKFERIIAVGATIIAVISLYFSWQANSIAGKAITSHLIVHYTNLLREESHGQGDPMQGEAFCDYSYLSSNIGGAGTSIIGQSVVVSFAGEAHSGIAQDTLLTQSTDNSTFIERFASVIMAMPYWGTTVVESGRDPMFEYWQGITREVFPIVFEPNSTREVFVRVWFKFNNTHRFGARWDNAEGYYPVYLSHRFQLSTGGELQTPTFVETLARVPGEHEKSAYLA